VIVMPPKINPILKSIFVVMVAISILGFMATAMNPKPLPPGIFSGTILSKQTNSGNGLFSGQIIPLAINPQPEPPGVFQIGMKTGRGLFSGKIVYVALNPQPEPPMPIFNR
jgi:hypothetical protein